MNNNVRLLTGTLAEEDIHAYVDGFLGPERRAFVEAYLAAHPLEAKRAEDYRAQNIQLHALLDRHQSEPIPPALQLLETQLDSALRRQWNFRKTVRIASSAAAVIALVLAGHWAYEKYAPASDPLVSFTKQAAQAHLLYAERSGNDPARQDDNSNDVNVVAWLSQRLTGAPLREPDLQAFGFYLSRARILPTSTGPAAQLLYRDEEGVPVTLYIAANKNKRQTGFTFVREGKTALFYWQNAGFAYSLAGEMDEDKLLQVAEVISRELRSIQPTPAMRVPIPKPAETDPNPMVQAVKNGAVEKGRADRSAALGMQQIFPGAELTAPNIGATSVPEEIPQTQNEPVPSSPATEVPADS